MNFRLIRLITQLLLAISTAIYTAGTSAAVGPQNPPPGPGQVPDYFGVVPNYANSPQPVLTTVKITDGTGIGATATAAVDNGVITNITVDNTASNSKYVNPTVTITDGGPGMGATATATVVRGVITNITVDNTGSNSQYVNPIISISDVGGGIGAVAAATTYDYKNWAQTDGITDVHVINGGSGYTANTTVTINGFGPSVTPASVTPSIINGVITGFTVVNAGSGYTVPMTGTGLRKFVNALPGIPGVSSYVTGPDYKAGANQLGQSLPVAVPDTTTFPGSDYYVIAETEYTQKMHSDLPPTHLRGYVQLDSTGNPMGANQYLGPIIVAQKDRPVRIKLINRLSIGKAGNLPFPVDTTYMGAEDTQNRTALHLHGGNTPWISDGTSRQTVKPAGESGPNKGVSASDVPDMWFDSTGNLILNDPGCVQGTTTCTTAGATNNPGDGALTFYYTNQQSARLMFYHDHTEGITRLNVYSGLAAGYVLQDPTEQAMVTNGTLPDLADTIPLIIQEKTFVPNNSKTLPVLNFYGPFVSQLNSQDPTWRWGSGAADTDNGTGDLWVPHVFMPNQNPGDVSGGNAMGRWDYGPWFWPPFTGIQHGPIANPYYDPTCVAGAGKYCEGQFIPGVPNGSTSNPNDPTGSPSGTPEAFNDTPLVNGTAYPTLTVDPKQYRLRLLSVGNDRMLNLSLVVAASKNSPTTANANAGATGAAELCDGTTNVDPADCTEVKMVPFNASQNQATPFPSHWYTFQKGGVTFDGRPSGVFDPRTRGPAMVQIGTEGGFLPNPAVIRNQPINFEFNPKNIVIGNIKEHALLLGPAERADVLVDFSNFAGSTLILYNDAPAPVPAFDLRVDYFTGDYDNTDTGGAFSTLPGYGPNTRTIMQIRVRNNGGASTHPVDDIGNIALPALTTAVQTAFKTSQEPIIVPQTAYNTVYGTAVSDTLGANLSRISDNWLTYNPLQNSLSGTISGSPVTLDLQPKTIIEDWTMNWGRMNALLGTEVPHTTMINQTSIPQAYIDPPTELVKLSPDDGAPITGTLADGTQLWKITHNGVDSHAVHFHLFHVQLVNRVGWDGAVRAPDANELGWKDTVRMNPLEDVIVALRPKTMTLPFKVPNSHRILDPSHIADANPNEFFNFDPTTGGPSNVTNTNVTTNFGWEYLWHCHILGHEENDMMRAIAVAQSPEAPTAISATGPATSVTVKWTDNSVISNWAQIQRDTVSTFDSANLKTINVVEPECAVQAGCERSYVDNTVPAATSVYYRVMANNTVGGGDARADVPRNPDGSYGSILPAELTSLTPGFTGYANATANSAWSGTVSRLAIPTASVTSGPLAFGNQLINTTSTAKTVTVTNTGTGNLAISGVALATGSQFGITHNCPATLAPAAMCTIDVTFKPTVAGALADTLTIIDNSNGIAGSKQTVALSGTSTAAPIANVLPAGPLTFGNVYVGTTSAAQKVTLSNSGTLPLAIASIVASAPYAQTNNCPATLAAGSNCAISVTFKPTSAVTSYGLLTITDNSNGVAGSKQTVALSGTGLPAGPVLNLVAVTNLTAQVNAANVMQLYWTDRSTLETGYRIQRCTGSIATTCAPLGGGWANVTAGIWPSGALTSPTNGLITATITATLAQNTISYRVYPLSGATVGPVSNTVSVNLAANPAAPSTVRATAGVGKVALTWIDVANNNTQYRFRSRYATAFNANGTVRTWSAWSNVTVNPAIGPNVQAATLSAAQIGATYKAGRTFQFQVGASNQAGTSYATASTNVVVK